MSDVDAVTTDAPPRPRSHRVEATQRFKRIPPERRLEKRITSEIGILLLVLAWGGAREWHWHWAAWAACLFGGGHAIAGDHRRFIVDWILGVFKDAGELAGGLATAAKTIRGAIATLLGKGNGS